MLSIPGSFFSAASILLKCNCFHLYKCAFLQKHTQDLCVFVSFVCLGLFCFVEVGIESITLCVTDNCSTIELYSQPLGAFFSNSNPQKIESQDYPSMMRIAVSQLFFTLNMPSSAQSEKHPQTHQLEPTLCFTVLVSPAQDPKSHLFRFRFRSNKKKAKPGIVVHICKCSSWEMDNFVPDTRLPI